MRRPKDSGGKRKITKYYGTYGKQGRPPNDYIPDVKGLEKKNGKFILIFNILFIINEFIITW